MKRTHTYRKRTPRQGAQHLPPAESSLPQRRPSNVIALHQNKGYRWKDQDPVVEQLCALIDQSGVLGHQIPQLIAVRSRGAASISSTTVYNILNGKTRRPHNYTIEWIAAAIGWKREWVRL